MSIRNIFKEIFLIKVLVIGKSNSIIHWAENAIAGFKQAGCYVDFFATNGDSIHQYIYFKLMKKAYRNKRGFISTALATKLKKFLPDLVIFVGMGSAQMFDITNETTPNVIKVAWIADKFKNDEAHFANDIDWIFCTDTARINDLKIFGFKSPSSYLPLAVNQDFFHPTDIRRTNKIIYVANNTAGREIIVRGIKKPITLYGKGWSTLKESNHEINAYRLPYKQLPRVYSSCSAVLNVKNEINVENGLNQRSFEPYGCMTPVLNDAMHDINKCFEDGTEILVYHSLDELNELHDRLVTDSRFAQSIGHAGYKRIIAEHTYTHRANTILSQVGLK